MRCVCSLCTTPLPPSTRTPPWIHWWKHMVYAFLVSWPNKDRRCNSSTGSRTRRFSNHVSRLLSRSHTFAIIVILDLKIHQSMWIHWPFFQKTWTKGPLTPRWPLTPCLLRSLDSTQGSLCPSPMTIHQCMWIQWSILQNTTYIHTHTYYVHTTYYVQNEWSHSLLLNSVQARQKRAISFYFMEFPVWVVSCCPGRNQGHLHMDPVSLPTWPVSRIDATFCQPRGQIFKYYKNLV